MKRAFVFPGQGSQIVGMGKDLFDGEFKEKYKLIDNLFHSYHGDNFSQLLSNVVFQGPEEDLTKTVFTQPAILTLSILLAERLKIMIKQGVIATPKYLAGHSLGEFSALFMADVIGFEDVVELVIERAALMHKVKNGTMKAIIGLEDEMVKGFTDKVEGVSIANYNSPNQVVITGTTEAVERVSSELEEFASMNDKKVRVIPLNVSGAFHSELMSSASAKFNELIDKVNFYDAAIPIVQNISASPVTDANQLKENLKKQMTGSVRWTETVKFFIDNGIQEIFEIGPGKVLNGLIKKQDRAFSVKNLSSLEDIKTLEKQTVN